MNCIVGDIAEKVVVSKARVPLVFRNAPGAGVQARQRVLAAAKELGYRMNRTAAPMTARRSHLIGAADARGIATVVEHLAELRRRASSTSAADPASSHRPAATATG